ncbi:MAG: radical SAM protein [Candidatus Latescibacterota bacterium]
MLPYDIEADWYVHRWCDFGCAYCIVGARPRLWYRRQWDIAAVERFLDARGLRWLVHFTGGEPFDLAEFVDLCRAITAGHCISVNSNLTPDCVLEFAEHIAPERVAFVHASLHIESREQRGQVPDLVAKVHLLRDRGFRVFVSQVMAPGVFPRFADDYRSLRDQGLIVHPKVLRGRFRGTAYPAAYTAARRAAFKEFHATALRDSPGPPDAGGESLSIDLRHDAVLVDGIPEFRGRPCQAGSRFVRVLADGTVTRCDNTTVLGHVGRNELRLADGPTPCDTRSCPYFCLKYSQAAPAA